MNAVQTAAAEIVKQCGDANAAHGIHIDLNRLETIPVAFDEVERVFGRPADILINNAGIINFAKFLDHDDETVARIFATNLNGNFAVAREAARRMAAAGGGSIINVGSTAGLRTPGYLSAYGVSKAGLIQLTTVMALELASKKIRVNALCPGNFVTEMHQVFTEHKIDESIVKRIPQRRLGSLEDLDGPILLLASDAGRYMTGTVITVDGGQTLSWL